MLDAVEKIRRVSRAGGRTARSAPSSLLEGFGFTGDKLTARLGDLSGGERRRLQLLRLLLDEPNVLLLDEPTNDLDIDTLTVLEDFLDGWPGTLWSSPTTATSSSASATSTYALPGDGRCVAAARRRRAVPGRTGTADRSDVGGGPHGARSEIGLGAGARGGKGDGPHRNQLGKLDQQIAKLHQAMAEAAADHVRVTELNGELNDLLTRKESLEDEWLALAED